MQTFLWTGGVVLVAVGIILLLTGKKLDGADDRVFDRFGGQRNKPGHNARVGWYMGLVGLLMLGIATVVTINT